MWFNNVRIWETGRNRWIAMLLRFLCFSVALLTGTSMLHAKKPEALCGCVYLSSGDSIVADGDTRIGAPEKKKKLEIIDRAYTRQSNVGNRIVATDVDSLTLWVPTAPDRPHRFRFVRDYGWCWLLEHTPYLTVYCFSSGGYHFAGNGGLWLRGKGTLLVVKDGVIYNFGRPDKKADEKFRRQMDSLVADDAELTDYIRKAKGRRDKILRRLSMYKHYNTKQL